jgi:3-methyl-2-oxobutanoate hydroxymethyltransferase
VGRTEDEARALRDRLRRLEEAGAFAVECELWAAQLLADATAHTGLVTISLGSGAGGDVQFLFTSDVCGDEGRRPRHAQAWGDVAALRARLREERAAALRGFRAAVADGSFPGPSHVVDADPAMVEVSRRAV